MSLRGWGLVTEVDPRSHYSNGTHYIYTSVDPEMSENLRRYSKMPIEADTETPNVATLEHIQTSALGIEDEPGPYNLTEYGCVMYSASWWTLYPPHFGQMFMLYVPIGATVIALSPAAIHRAMISGSDDSFRRALAPVHCEFANLRLVHSSLQFCASLSSPLCRSLVHSSLHYHSRRLEPLLLQTTPGSSCCRAS